MRRTKYINGNPTNEDACFCVNKENKISFLAYIQNANERNSRAVYATYGQHDIEYTFTEVPASCVKNLFGCGRWEGSRSWPK